MRQMQGMAEALRAVFPVTTLQMCMVHLIRNSLDYASWKDCKALAAAIKPIYSAPSAEAALAELGAFEQGAWGAKFPDFATAIAYLRTAISIVPDRAEFHNNLGSLLAAVGSREEGAREFERALQLRPMFPEAHANLRKLQSR
jgi:transposase-like protein